MSSPHRVLTRFQLNDPTTILDGLNCGPTAGAMALDRQTLGKHRPYGGQVRALTGDTSGGTTNEQIRDALYKGWGVSLEVRRGAYISWLWDGLRAGRGASVSGSSSATKDTIYRASETFAGNHQMFWAQGGGWRLVNGVWLPDFVLAYDPLADGRRSGIAKSPFWLPRRYAEAFLARLDLGGGRRLGSGRVYAMLTRDTEPHFHARYAGAKGFTAPMPRTGKVRVAAGHRANVRVGPGTRYGMARRADGSAETLAAGTTFLTWQWIDTTPPPGSSDPRWYGDHDGRRWVHRSNISLGS